ncbi:MAG: hypothetical protein IIT58_07980 [Treponema sp.]|nr:hypothetical protein [Treponema sp.]
MKRLFLFAVCLSCIILGSCSKKGSSVQKNSSIQKGNEAEVEKKPRYIKTDLDMTGLNYNMISSLLFNMLVEPETYLGKRIKMKGQFYSEFDETNFVRHYSVLIYDATACCQTGLQFIRQGEYVFPDDYPEQMTEITVSGILKIKDLNGMDYLYLDCDYFEI